MYLSGDLRYLAPGLLAHRLQTDLCHEPKYFKKSGWFKCER